MWRVHLRSHPTVGPWVARFDSKPGWVWKTAGLAAILTIVVPMVALVLAAVLVGCLVFAVLGLVAWVIGVGKSLLGRTVQWPDSDQRINVRVIDD